MSEKPVVAVIGGTGREGSSLARRWALAGYTVIVGSRDAGRAQATAAGFSGNARGAVNEDAARDASIVVLTVPYAAQIETLKSIEPFIQGKILVDVTVPLMPPKVSRVQLPPSGSAVVDAQQRLGPSVRVVSAFQNVSAEALANPKEPVACDVLVCGDDADAREAVVTLAVDGGMRAWHAGLLSNSAAAEALTSLLIFINREYGSTHAGIMITGAQSRS